MPIFDTCTVLVSDAQHFSFLFLWRNFTKVENFHEQLEYVEYAYI